MFLVYVRCLEHWSLTTLRERLITTGTKWAGIPSE